MARWEPDARGRLEKAAMELFQERGYTNTTVSDIAERAGLTERTFFRHFSDKREVLFSGSNELEETLVHRIIGASPDAAPLEVVAAAFESLGAWLQERRDLSYVRARYAIVTDNAEVRERELIKMASLAAAVTRALHARGGAEPAASIVAEAGLAVFKVGFERWVAKKEPGELAAHIRAALSTLKALTTSAPPPPRPRAPSAKRARAGGRAQK